jgi:dynein light intermediate chain 1, cytosolic
VISNREIEVQTEDEQAFLARQQQLLQQGQPARGESPMRIQDRVQRQPSSGGTGVGSQNSPNKKVSHLKNKCAPPEQL